MEEQYFEAAREVGHHLRRVRSEKGIDLQHIAKTTNISLFLLQSLEDGKWERVYSPFFVVSFLKAYCEAIGEPWESIASSVKSITCAMDRSLSQSGSYRKLLTQRSPFLPRKRSFFFYAMIIVLGVAMASGGLFIAKHQTRLVLRDHQVLTGGEGTPLPQEVVNTLRTFSQHPDQLKNRLEEAQRPPVTLPGNSPGASGMTRERGNATSPLQVEAGSLSKGHRLTIEAKGESWIRLWIDDGKPISKLMSEGDSIEFTVVERAKVSIGNAQAVKLWWDDKVFDQLGRKGRVVTLVFPDALKKLKTRVQGDAVQ